MRNEFIGRDEELEKLESQYASDRFEMTVVYGRRRVGKSTLLQKFASGKRAVFFTAVRTTLQRNLELFGQRIFEALVPENAGMRFSSPEAILPSAWSLL